MDAVGVCDGIPFADPVFETADQLSHGVAELRELQSTFRPSVAARAPAVHVAAVWASFGAIAHSSGFVLIFTAMVRVSRSDAEAATMSALVQGGGYVLAALGAPLLGALNEISGGWQAPMLAVIAATVVYSTALVSAMFVALRRG